MKIQEFTKESLKRRLQKSLSYDWVPESRAYSFRLRENYVQLNWKRKLRKAMGVETVACTGLHELIKEKMKLSAAAGHGMKSGPSVIIEGKIKCDEHLVYNLLATCPVRPMDL